MRPIIWLCLLLGLFGCSPEKVKERKDWDKVFQEYGVKGSFLLYDLRQNSYLAYDYARCEQGFIPASTFKILNALIGLETGILADEKAVFKWDGKERNVAAWNQDHSLRSAIKVSCVPCFQDLARRIGEDNLKKYLIRTEYGNQKMGAKVDNFWLEGDLRISQRQQIEFLKKLYLDELPFSRSNQHTVKKIILLEEKETYKLYGKTGWGMQDGKNIGWWVGFVEKGNEVYFFANNIESNQVTDAQFQKARLEITQRFLRELKIM